MSGCFPPKFARDLGRLSWGRWVGQAGATLQVYGPQFYSPSDWEARWTSVEGLKVQEGGVAM